MPSLVLTRPRLPNLLSFPTSCVCLELRSLPSTGITRLPRYYGPLRHPKAPGLSLTGVRLVIPAPRQGASRVACVSLVYMPSPLPRRSDWVHSSLASPAVSAFPKRVFRSACALSFSRLGRVDRPLPVLQAEVGVLCWPPGFPTVPQYLSHTRVRKPAPRRTGRGELHHPAPSSSQPHSRWHEEIVNDAHARKTRSKLSPELSPG